MTSGDVRSRLGQVLGNVRRRFLSYPVHYRTNRVGFIIGCIDRDCSLVRNGRDAMASISVACCSCGLVVLWVRVVIASGVLHVLHDFLRGLALASGHKRPALYGNSVETVELSRPSDVIRAFSRFAGLGLISDCGFQEAQAIKRIRRSRPARREI